MSDIQKRAGATGFIAAAKEIEFLHTGNTVGEHTARHNVKIMSNDFDRALATIEKLTKALNECENCVDKLRLAKGD